MDKFKYLLIGVFLFGLYYFEASQMFLVKTSLSLSIFYPICILSSAIVFIINSGPSQNNELKPLITLIIFTYILSLIHSFFTPFPARYYYLTLILPAVSCIFIYKVIFANIIKRDLLLAGLSIVYVLLVIFFFSNYRNNLFLDSTNQNNAAYTILYFTPIILCIRKNTIRYIAVAVTAIALLFSLKRGGTIAFVLALIAYLYVELFILSNKRNKFSYFVFLSICILGLYEVVTSAFSEQGSLLIDRFSLSDDGGSGREEIYRKVLELISNDSLLGLVFGNGYNGVAINGGLGISAHNDYLEYAYDFGIFGLLLLIIFVYKYGIYVLKLLKCKSFYSGPAVFAFVILLVNSTVSHIFFYSTYLLLFSIFWGYLYATTSKENEIYTS